MELQNVHRVSPLRQRQRRVKSAFALKHVCTANCSTVPFTATTHLGELNRTEGVQLREEQVLDSHPFCMPGFDGEWLEKGRPYFRTPRENHIDTAKHRFPCLTLQKMRLLSAEHLPLTRIFRLGRPPPPQTLQLALLHPLPLPLLHPVLLQPLHRPSHPLQP